MSRQIRSPRVPVEWTQLTAAELQGAGLLHADEGVRISRFAIFVSADAHGVRRPVVIEAGAVVGAFAIVHGGTAIGRQARIEDHAIVGQPELGYAVGRIYHGVGATTALGDGVVVRAGAVLYAEVIAGRTSPHSPRRGSLLGRGWGAARSCSPESPSVRMRWSEPGRW